jgi:hypothetical protein
MNNASLKMEKSTLLLWIQSENNINKETVSLKCTLEFQVRSFSFCSKNTLSDFFQYDNLYTEMEECRKSGKECIKIYYSIFFTYYTLW